MSRKLRSPRCSAQGPRTTRPTRSRLRAGASSARGRAQVGQGGQCSFRGGRQPKRKYQVVRGLNNLGYSERLGCRVVGLDRSTYYGVKFHQPSDGEVRRLLLADATADITPAPGAPTACCGYGRPWRSNKGS